MIHVWIRKHPITPRLHNQSACDPCTLLTRRPLSPSPWTDDNLGTLEHRRVKHRVQTLRRYLRKQSPTNLVKADGELLGPLELSKKAIIHLDSYQRTWLIAHMDCHEHIDITRSINQVIQHGLLHSNPVADHHGGHRGRELSVERHCHHRPLHIGAGLAEQLLNFLVKGVHLAVFGNVKLWLIHNERIILAPIPIDRIHLGRLRMQTVIFECAISQTLLTNLM
mmetsp:Transcript_126396/g.219211  ORF Transcript_126396/g.219211 Transcript_126396/m.219211 type:complete len:223 (-) Transcript_126396:36-704(-)